MPSSSILNLTLNINTPSSRNRMDQTTARIRKTFRYPAENDSHDDLPEALDEEEQEQLIQSLQTQNASLNAIYRRILLAVPLLSSIPYIPTLFTPRTTLLSILSITSLLSTTWLLSTLPPGETGIPLLDALNKSPAPLSRRERLQKLEDEGPIRQYLPYLNGALCLILVLLGAVEERKNGLWWGFGWLPAGIYGVVILAKWVMGSVDPEGELTTLKYDFKGA